MSRVQVTTPRGAKARRICNSPGVMRWRAIRFELAKNSFHTSRWDLGRALKIETAIRPHALFDPQSSRHTEWRRR